MENRKKKNIKDIKYHLKRYTNKTWKKVTIFFISLLMLNAIVYYTTGKNIIERTIRALLYQVGIYTEEIKSVDITSSDWYNKEPGSWSITKSADWISLNKAQVTIDLNSVIKSSEKKKDVIFVLDISGSMGGDKINKVIEDSIELTEYILSDSTNNVALITFDQYSEILSDFTNDKEYILDLLSSIKTTGATNYNAALKNVDKILENYQYNKNREAVVLFLTDGYPNEETPNQIAEYQYLKERYPYIYINGIQYEMGSEIIKEIKNISDAQFIAYVENLNNVLFEAAISPENYESFEIVDYIDNDYFHIESIDDITVDIGDFSLIDESGQQKLIWNFNDLLRTGENVKMTITLTLNDEYQFNEGLYPTNKKEVIKDKLLDSDIRTTNSTKTPVLQNGYKIIYDTNVPKECGTKTTTIETHYAFETVEKKSEELTCSGYLFKGWEIEERVTKINDDTFIMPSNDIHIRGTWTKQEISKSMDGTIHEKATLWRKVKNDAENGLYGAKTLSSSVNDKYKVYYYTSASNNHVYFANSCWQIIRTTDTGGVKLLYEGKPLNGTTCGNLDTTTIPKSAYSTEKSLANIGYMYNKSYFISSKYIDYKSYRITSMITASNFKYFGDTYTISDGKYVVQNKDGSPVERKIWSEDFSNLTGYYSCYGVEGTTCSKLYYITGADKIYAYTLELTDAKNIDDVNTDIKLGKGYTKNSDGTYTLNSLTTIKKSDWYSSYKNYKDYYICDDYSKTTCTDLKVILDISTNTNITTESVNNNSETNTLYGNSFTYDGTNYHLVDTVKSDLWSNFYDKLDNNHYTCLNNTGICEKVYYLTNTNIRYKYYYELSDGLGINDIINEMLFDSDVNKINSNAKDTLDKWYEDNLLDYTDDIEDTVYCNNRNIYNLNSLNPNGGSLKNTELLFEDGISPSLTCPNITDRFTVSSEIGNGALKYPIGLLTKKEANLIGKGLLGSFSTYWLSTPYQFYLTSSDISMAYGYNGNLAYNLGYAKQYVIPVISIKNNIGYISGNGSSESPYIIE